MPIIIDKRYKLIEKIGEGGMGTVYRGVDMKRNNRLVAIKQLKQDTIQDDPSMIRRFKREGNVLRNLNHPNIVRCFDGPIDWKKDYYIIMEYVDGGTLQELLARYGRLSPHKALSIALELSDALTRAHHLKVIHRDLKPANVLLTQQEKPRLTDFGIAHIVDQTRLTTTRSLVGTWAYLSPEAIQGRVELDERADIWSFGILLYEIFEGHIPYDDLHPSNIVNSILNGTIEMGERMPVRVRALVEQMLQKDRNQRIPSMRAVGAELHSILHDTATIEIRTPTNFMNDFSELMDSYYQQYQSFHKLLTGSQTVDRQVFHYLSGAHSTYRVLIKEINDLLIKHNMSLPPVPKSNHMPISVIAVDDLFQRARISVVEIHEQDDYVFTVIFAPTLNETNTKRLTALEQFMPNVMMLLEGYTEDNYPYMDIAFRHP